MRWVSRVDTRARRINHPAVRTSVLLPSLALVLAACLASPPPEGEAKAGKRESADTEAGNTQPGKPASSEPAPSKTAPSEPAPAPADALGMIGSKRSETCSEAMKALAELRTGEPMAAMQSFDLSYRAADGKIAAWVESTDKGLARVDESGAASDHAAILAALDLAKTTGTQTAFERARIDVIQILHRVALIDMRYEFERVAKAGTPEGLPLDDRSALIAGWDEAFCLWDGALRPLVQAVDVDGGEAWEEQIVEAFMSGRGGLTGEFDAARVKSQREIAEKSTYAAIQRLILANAATAKQANDARVARVAKGLLGTLEDRIADRNGPGLARVQAMLSGQPSEIDVDAIERELAKAFVKRARKYCDEAVANNLLGKPEGIKGAWEGMTYAKLILPGMRETLAGQSFDADAHMADWASYLEAIEDLDVAGATAISERLVQWNCAYQEALGIAKCTVTDNEVQ